MGRNPSFWGDGSEAVVRRQAVLKPAFFVRLFIGRFSRPEKSGPFRKRGFVSDGKIEINRLTKLLPENKIFNMFVFLLNIRIRKCL
jgi:hypothetical protein